MIGRQRQFGISLVEIMVALVLSLLLSAGIIEVYFSAKQSYRAQEGYSRLQENARYALDILGRYLRFTGYKINPLDTNSVFTPASGGIADQEVIAGTDGGNTASDTITFRYQDDGLLGDCQTSPPGAVAPDTIRTNRFYVTNSNVLMCLDVATNTAQPLVDGVENMQILYGIDTDSDGYANQYVAASSVGATGNGWKSVASVRISLLMSTLQNVSMEADSATWNLVSLGMASGNAADFTIAAPAANAPSRFFRRHFFTTTIGLRNNLP